MKGLSEEELCLFNLKNQVVRKTYRKQMTMTRPIFSTLIQSYCLEVAYVTVCTKIGMNE